MPISSKHIDFHERKACVISGGGAKAIEKQIALGKLTARDRINALLAMDSFHEYDLFVEQRCRDFNMDKKDLPGDGVVRKIHVQTGHQVTKGSLLVELS